MLNKLLRLKSSFASFGFGAAFALGVCFVVLLLFASGRGGGFLSNPFGFATTISPSGPVVMQEIQKLARLETARYKGHTVVKGDTSSGILPSFIAGDKLVFVGHGEVVAGVDLAKIQPEDVVVENGRATVKLPPAEIFHTNLDNDQSEVFERSTGILSKPDAQLETKVRQEAETRIREAAIASGVLKNAEVGAHEALRKLLLSMGLREVTFK